MSDHTLAQTINGLRNTADGVNSTKASIELLIAHETWLLDPTFKRHLTYSRYNGKDFLRPDWRTLLLDLDTHGTSQPGSAVKILRIAAALYDNRCPISLASNLHSLGPANRLLILNAMGTAMGHREPSVSS